MNVNYGTVINGLITAPLTMCSNFNGIGAWHTLSDDERAEHGWFPADVFNENYDPRIQTRSDAPVCAFDGERITATYTLSDKNPELIKSGLLDQLAEIRFSVETAGVVSSDGVNQSTDRAERLVLADKLAFMRSKPDLKVTHWKAAGKWHTLTLEQLAALYAQVGTHVDNCYIAEHTVAQQLENAKKPAQLLAINLASAFDDAMPGI